MAHDIRGFFCSSHETSDSKVTQPLGNEDDKTDVSHPKRIQLDSEITVPRRKAKRKYK